MRTTNAQAEAIRSMVFVVSDLANQAFADQASMIRNVYFRDNVHVVAPNGETIVRIHLSAVMANVLNAVDSNDRNTIITNTIALADLPIEWDGSSLWFTVSAS